MLNIYKGNKSLKFHYGFAFDALKQLQRCVIRKNPQTHVETQITRVNKSLKRLASWLRLFTRKCVYLVLSHRPGDEAGGMNERGGWWGGYGVRKVIASGCVRTQL